MKAVFLAFLLMSCFAYTQIKHLKGADILSKLKDEKSNEVIVVMFTIGDYIKSNPELEQLVNKYEEGLSNILQRYPSFSYARVDAANQDYQDLVDAAAILPGKLQKGPAILMSTRGEGIWTHGDEAVEKIAEYAPLYEQKAKAKKE